MGKTTERLWNRTFIILFQGQFISDLGNGIFNAILSFWVLELTHSKVMMGTILACLALPRVALGAFAGTFADRHSRKWIIVASDAIRGLLFVLVGAWALLAQGQFPAAVLYPMAVLSGVCSAFFSPAITSALPDIVPHSQLTRANSLRTFSQSASSFVGYACGGVLYAACLKAPPPWHGAPPLVLGYGICFIYAAITQLFMKIPLVKRESQPTRILRDMWDGLKYTYRQKGIRALITIGMFLNFFAMMGVTLLTPLFDEERAHGYGEALYGAVMATMMVGQLIGMLLVSTIKLKPRQRPVLFFLAVGALIGGMIPVGLVRSPALMFPLALIVGTAIAIMTILIYTLLQTTVQPENRGRVFGVVTMVFEGLSPVAMAVSGFVAELFGVRPTIVGAFACAAVVLGFSLFNHSFKVFLRSEPIGQKLPAEGNQLPPV